MGKQLKLPEVAAKTELRTDAVLLSAASKQVNPLELTVPWEHCMWQANKRKRAKRSMLVEECRSLVWRTYRRGMPRISRPIPTRGLGHNEGPSSGPLRQQKWHRDGRGPRGKRRRFGLCYLDTTPAGSPGGEVWIFED